MRYGIVLPNLGGCGDARLLADLARQAEDAGWDGVFLFDCILAKGWDRFFEDEPQMRGVADPWIALAAMAMKTERVLLGPMITPVTRRRPWKLARETVTLEHLSRGRLVLPVGLGAVDDGGFAKVNEETDLRRRAERLDEGLAILEGLWSGEPFSFRGEHFRVNDLHFLPKPLQSPRIPIWVVALWPYERSLRRALRWDGIIPARREGVVSEGDLREIRAYIEKQRGSGGELEIIYEGETSTEDRDRALARERAFANAGVTWWLESGWTRVLKPPQTLDRLRRRIDAGPPRL